MTKFKVTKHFGGNTVDVVCHKIGKHFYPVSQFNERGLLKPGAKPLKATWGCHLISERL